MRSSSFTSHNQFLLPSRSFDRISLQNKSMAKLEVGMETLLAAVTDGRTENVRYRQNELYSLFKGLKEKSNEIRLAISQTASSGSNTKSAETEFFLGMDAIRQAYEGLDFDRSLKDEYLVTKGTDNSKRRVGLGIVVIRPTEHSRFYSIISPLASAISAGNCVLVEVSRPLKLNWEVINESMRLEIFNHL